MSFFSDIFGGGGGTTSTTSTTNQQVGAQQGSGGIVFGAITAHGGTATSSKISNTSQNLTAPLNNSSISGAAGQNKPVDAKSTPTKAVPTSSSHTPGGSTASPTANAQSVAAANQAGGADAGGNVNIRVTQSDSGAIAAAQAIATSALQLANNAVYDATQATFASTQLAGSIASQGLQTGANLAAVGIGGQVAGQLISPTSGAAVDYATQPAAPTMDTTTLLMLIGIGLSLFLLAKD